MNAARARARGLANRRRQIRSLAAAGKPALPWKVRWVHGYRKVGQVAQGRTLTASLTEQTKLGSLSTRFRSGALPRRPGSGYNHPCRLAQRNRMVEMAIMAASTTARWGKSVRSFTMMFIPYTDDSAVIGKVSTAIRARRSAAIVTLVSVRAL